MGPSDLRVRKKHFSFYPCIQEGSENVADLILNISPPKPLPEKSTVDFLTEDS